MQISDFTLVLLRYSLTVRGVVFRSCFDNTQIQGRSNERVLLVLHRLADLVAQKGDTRKLKTSQSHKQGTI